MGFKLVKLDSGDCCKVQLEVGKHLIGRGKLLHCDDKRVSRKHGELQVKDLSLVLTALHTNPCFYVRKGTNTREILKQNNHVELLHGDKFGLLPVDCWYEVLFEPDFLESDRVDGVQNNVENRISENNGAMLDATEFVNDITSTEVVENPGIEFQQPLNGNVSNPAQPENDTSNQDEGDVSQSLITDVNFPPFSPGNDLDIPQDLIDENPLEQQNSYVKMEPVDQIPQQQLHVKEEPPSPLKRPLPSTSAVKQESGIDDVKRIKTEPDAAAGTSNGQNASPAAQPGPAAPPRPRERCMYGANCYRQNPIHKQEYSHPSDPDWGPGERGVCPYGAACVRRNPRHWTDNIHPPGTVPPAARPVQGNKQRKKKRQSTDSEDSGQDTLSSPDVILTGKRARKKIVVEKWSDSESNGDEDPFQTDDEDDWRPSGSLGNDSQYTQDD